MTTHGNACSAASLGPNIQILRNDLSSPDRQVSEMAGRAGLLRSELVGGVACHLDNLPEGYHATGRGQAWKGDPGRDAKSERPLWMVALDPDVAPTRDVIGLRQVDEMARATAVSGTGLLRGGAQQNLTFAKLLILKWDCGVDLRVRCRAWPN